MGVHGLWSILEPVRRHCELCSLSGQTLAVDLSIWVVESLSVWQMQGHVTKPHLRNLFFRVSHLLHLGVQPVFVIDGEAPELKWEVMAKRQQSKVREKRGSAPAKASKQKRSHFKMVLKECCEMLDHLGVPYVYSQGEAEAFCALLNAKGLVDGCITDDGDVFLYGAKTVYRNFTINTKDPHVESYTAADIERDIGLSRNDMVALAILLGCDYLPNGVPGVGKKNVNKLIKTLRNEDLLKRLSDWRAISRSKLYPAEIAIHKKALALPDFPNPKVIAEFLSVKDTCPKKPLTCNRPKLYQSQRYFLQKMEWPDEYSEEKVLPLVTLYDMNDIYVRGYHDAQRHIIPHRIVKRRVRQFVPCFEVEWYKGHTNSSANSTKDFYTTIEEERRFSRAFPDIAREFQQNEATRQAGKKKVPSLSSQQISNKQGAYASQTAEDDSGNVAQASSDVMDLSDAIHHLDLSSQTSLQINPSHELRTNVHCIKPHCDMESFGDGFCQLNLENIATCSAGSHRLLSNSSYPGYRSQNTCLTICSKEMTLPPPAASSVFACRKTHTCSPSINRDSAIKCHTVLGGISDSSHSDDSEEEHTIPLLQRIGLQQHMQEKVHTAPSRMLSSQNPIPFADKVVDKILHNEELNTNCLGTYMRLPDDAAESHFHPALNNVPNVLLDGRTAAKGTETPASGYGDSDNVEDIIDISDDYLDDMPVESDKYEVLTNVVKQADKHDIKIGKVSNGVRNTDLIELLPGSGITASFLEACSKSYISEKKPNDVSSFAEELIQDSATSREEKPNLASVMILPLNMYSHALISDAHSLCYIKTTHGEINAACIGSVVHGKTDGEHDITFNTQCKNDVITVSNISEAKILCSDQLQFANSSLEHEKLQIYSSDNKGHFPEILTLCGDTKHLSQDCVGNDIIAGELCFVTDECSPINRVLSFDDKLSPVYTDESPVQQSSLNNGIPHNSNDIHTPLLGTSNASVVSHGNNSNMNSLDLFADSLGSEFSCNAIPDFTNKMPRHFPVNHKPAYDSYIATPEVVQSRRCSVKHKSIQPHSSFFCHPTNDVHSNCSSELCVKSMSVKVCNEEIDYTEKLSTGGVGDNMATARFCVTSPPSADTAVTRCSTSTPCVEEFTGSSVSPTCPLIYASPTSKVITDPIIDCFNGNLTDNVFLNSDLSINAYKHNTQELTRNLTSPASYSNVCSTSTPIAKTLICIIQKVKELMQNEGENDCHLKNIQDKDIHSPPSLKTELIKTLHVEPHAQCMPSTPVASENCQCVDEVGNNIIGIQEQLYTHRHVDRPHTTTHRVSFSKVKSEPDVQILKDCEYTGRMNSVLCNNISENHIFKQPLYEQHVIAYEAKQRVSHDRASTEAHYRQSKETVNLNQCNVVNVCNKESIRGLKTDRLAVKPMNHLSGQCESTRRTVQTLPVSCDAHVMKSNINVSNLTVHCNEATSKPLNNILHVLKDKENIKDRSPLALADRLRLRLGGIPVMKS